ncbi:MAG: glycosyltransferase family 2 protein, partial [Verrucomicrobiota bacterium]
RATVLLPTTGDRGPILKYSVASLLNQTVDEWELFIIGDGVDEETRITAEEIAKTDSRIRFFAFSKDDSRGEVNRHQLLMEEARGEIVCYLCDRDLYLPNHLDTMLHVLEHNDIAITLHVPYKPNGRFRFSRRIHPASDFENGAAFKKNRFGPLSLTAHTLEAYKRLPFGWRETPKDQLPTDRYMWRQFLEQEWIRFDLVYKLTVIHLKRGGHPGLSTDQRVELSQKMYDLFCSGAGIERFYESVLHDLLRNQARRDSNQNFSGARKAISEGNESKTAGFFGGLKKLKSKFFLNKSS